MAHPNDRSGMLPLHPNPTRSYEEAMTVQRDHARAALTQIRAFCETRMAEGTKEHADMCHIANICKEAA